MLITSGRFTSGYHLRSVGWPTKFIKTTLKIAAVAMREINRSDFFRTNIVEWLSKKNEGRNLFPFKNSECQKPRPFIFQLTLLPFVQICFFARQSEDFTHMTKLMHFYWWGLQFYFYWSPVFPGTKVCTF